VKTNRPQCHSKLAQRASGNPVDVMEKHRIHDAPASMFYIHDFITEEEEEHILDSASGQ